MDDWYSKDAAYWFLGKRRITKKYQSCWIILKGRSTSLNHMRYSWVAAQKSREVSVSIQHRLRLVPHRQACRASPDTRSLPRAHGTREITARACFPLNGRKLNRSYTRCARQLCKNITLKHTMFFFLFYLSAWQQKCLLLLYFMQLPYCSLNVSVSVGFILKHFFFVFKSIKAVL